MTHALRDRQTLVAASGERSLHTGPPLNKINHLARFLATLATAIGDSLIGRPDRRVRRGSHPSIRATVGELSSVWIAFATRSQSVCS
jgi:hypothetical protein